jgi:hypothetical protein
MRIASYAFLAAVVACAGSTRGRESSPAVRPSPPPPPKPLQLERSESAETGEPAPILRLLEEERRRFGTTSWRFTEQDGARRSETSDGTASKAGHLRSTESTSEWNAASHLATVRGGADKLDPAVKSPSAKNLS